MLVQALDMYQFCISVMAPTRSDGIVEAAGNVITPKDGTERECDRCQSHVVR